MFRAKESIQVLSNRLPVSLPCGMFGFLDDLLVLSYVKYILHPRFSALSEVVLEGNLQEPVRLMAMQEEQEKLEA